MATDPQSILDEALQRIATLEAQVHELNLMVNRLLTVPRHGAEAEKKPRKPVKDPPEFDGKDKDFASTFVSHLDLYFSAYKDSFTDEQKITTAASFLRGHAFRWFEPYLRTGDENPDARIRTDYAYFCQQLIHNLGDPDRSASLKRQLKNLRQTGAASAYAAEFQRIASMMDWNESSLREQFYENLKPEVKDRLSYTISAPESLKDYMTLVIQVDNRLHERRLEQRRELGKPRTLKGDSTKQHENRQNIQPMELDTLARGPLSPNERQRRVKNNLCIYCAGSDHTVEKCPNKTSTKNTNPQGNRKGINAFGTFALSPPLPQPEGESHQDPSE